MSHKQNDVTVTITVYVTVYVTVSDSMAINFSVSVYSSLLPLPLSFSLHLSHPIFLSLIHSIFVSISHFVCRSISLLACVCINLSLNIYLSSYLMYPTIYLPFPFFFSGPLCSCRSHLHFISCHEARSKLSEYGRIRSS